MKIKSLMLSFLLLVSCNQVIVNSFDSKTSSTSKTSSSSSESLISTLTSELETTSFNETIESESTSLSLDTSFTTSENDEKEFTLNILSINDLHGKIEQTNQKQGISNLSAVINNIRNENELDDVVLIANGDMFQGQAISNLNHGLSVINAMNAMDFDMMGIGNHEFDWGIEEITRFFDGDKENGEANFPLVNSNVFYNDSDQLLEYSKPYHIIMKEGVKIGLISALGQDQYSSILKSKSEKYVFKDMLSYLKNNAQILKEKEKCDIVIANIHDGGTTSYFTEMNNSLASLKDNYKIDALINGHTHYGYAGLITRDNEVDLPVVQAYSSGSSLGVIKLDIKNKKVLNASSELIDMRYNLNYDQKIQDIVDNDYNLLKDKIEETYNISGETVSEKELIQNWAGSCMQKALDADIAFSNNGGLRGVNLIKGQEIKLKDIYVINPFDNEILLANISGKNINNFLSRYSSSNYNVIKDGVVIENSASKFYKVAVIDYLGFKNYFPLGQDYINTGLIFRDIMILDIKKRRDLNMEFCPVSSSNSYLEKLI